MKIVVALVALVLLCSVAAGFTAQPVQPSRVVYFETKESSVQPMDFEVLQAYGDIGWLLIAVVPYPPGRPDGYRWQYIFRSSGVCR